MFSWTYVTHVHVESLNFQGRRKTKMVSCRWWCTSCWCKTKFKLVDVDHPVDSWVHNLISEFDAPVVTTVQGITLCLYRFRMMLSSHSSGITLCAEHLLTKLLNKTLLTLCFLRPGHNSSLYTISWFSCPSVGQSDRYYSPVGPKP